MDRRVPPRWLIWLVVALSFIMTSCSKKYVRLSMIGSTDLNSGGNIVVVYIYQLTSNVNFERATLESFWQERDADKSLLGGELIEKMEIMLHPKERRLLRLDIANDANYLAVAANFHNPNKDRWRQIIPIAPYKGKELWVVAGKDAVLITEQPSR